jgi:transglutaminase-like putative cysteine protease
LTFAVSEPARFAVQVAPAAGAGAIHREQLEITLDDRPVDVTHEHRAMHGGRIHVFRSEPGTLTLNFATLLRAAPQPAVSASHGEAHDDGFAALFALRQSRYCESDRLAGFVATEFSDVARDDAYATAMHVASWVFERLAYAVGASGPLDSAVDTLLTGAGVCRDYAHLTIALCRALGVPARFASVYAPGISPMDFHAVTEVLVTGTWLVLDSTRLAPRSELVRIATGRDAADTAFATVLDGRAELVSSHVFASSDGLLPGDDHATPVALA